MRATIGLLAVATFTLLAAAVAAQQGRGGVPTWAYAATGRGFMPDPDDGQPKHLPGSARSYTYPQIQDAFSPVDWYPSDHPRMPDVPVAHGRRPDVRACAWCHLPNGIGYADSAAIAGLPAIYMTEQLTYFKLGLRTSSVTGNSIMGTIVRALTERELKDAVDYYAGLRRPRTSLIKVVEATTVPTTRIVADNLRIPLDPTETEPLGQRIVELPENAARTRLRDAHSTFVAYVPVGSIRRGLGLVKTGARLVDGKIAVDKALACPTCHGTTLRGMPPAPGTKTPTPALAGMSPTYIVRQLYDFQSGSRGGESAAVMKPVVAQLSVDDMIAIAAYLSSRP